MKQFTEQQIDDIIKLKFGAAVTSQPRIAYVTNKALGQAFGVSASQIRKLYMKRFEQHRDKQLPLIQRLRKSPQSMQ